MQRMSSLVNARDLSSTPVNSRHLSCTLVNTCARLSSLVHRSCTLVNSELGPCNSAHQRFSLSMFKLGRQCSFPPGIRGQSAANKRLAMALVTCVSQIWGQPAGIAGVSLAACGVDQRRHPKPTPILGCTLLPPFLAFLPPFMYSHSETAFQQ